MGSLKVDTILLDWIRAEWMAVQGALNERIILAPIFQGAKNANSPVNVCDQFGATGSSGLEPPAENSCSSLFLPTITPDGQYVMSGWTDSGIHIWNENGNYVTTLYGHEGPPYNVTFNPKCAILASSCLNVALWQPSI
ncbi:hypothetical protein PCYB_146840 [Plasmodium cynomolgi strain B]|uniref:Uncharacterized protein n=1 Tax=Plasmodium cynomolgi (strain B) TaxID=1120755 RepID=K6UF04_PLACD|nr:hypothetical protein PCYB_146840 [Plasmodium cynomolgi strain B]GAB69256.1 hypothetical protein PCYB_146840 [Plasmodium cynomolgi strain B]